ncbi:hypothetical protein ACJJTC_019770, partial [Scirpophaga incertulas]
ASLLLGTITSSLPIEGECQEGRGLVTPQQVEELGEHLGGLLSRAQHRGAFEQVYVAFTQLLATLWRCRQRRLHELPAAGPAALRAPGPPAGPRHAPQRRPALPRAGTHRLHCLHCLARPRGPRHAPQRRPALPRAGTHCLHCLHCLARPRGPRHAPQRRPALPRAGTHCLHCLHCLARPRGRATRRSAGLPYLVQVRTACTACTAWPARGAAPRAAAPACPTSCRYALPALPGPPPAGPRHAPQRRPALPRAGTHCLHCLAPARGAAPRAAAPACPTSCRYALPALPGPRPRGRATRRSAGLPYLVQVRTACTACTAWPARGAAPRAAAPACPTSCRYALPALPALPGPRPRGRATRRSAGLPYLVQVRTACTACTAWPARGAAPRAAAPACPTSCRYALPALPALPGPPAGPRHAPQRRPALPRAGSGDNRTTSARQPQMPSRVYDDTAQTGSERSRLHYSSKPGPGI